MVSSDAYYDVLKKLSQIDTITKFRSNKQIGPKIQEGMRKFIELKIK